MPPQLNMEDITLTKELRKTADLVKYIEQLEQEALVDHLTQLYNQRAFEKLGAAEIEQAQRHKRTLSLVVIDLDSFKEVNDRFGHDAGDELLRRFVDLIRATLRPSDLAFRFHGDEFGILLRDTDEAGAIRTINRLTERAAKSSIAFSAGHTTLHMFSGPASEMLQTIFRVADQHMFKVKQEKQAQFV